MKVKEENEKVGLNLNIQKTKIMESTPITSFQIDGETMETLRDFIFLGSKITAYDDCIHEIKRQWILGRRVLTNLDSILRSWDVTLSKKVPAIQSYRFFSSHVWMWELDYKAEFWTTDAVELWCWRRLLRVLWTTRRYNQSILKEISPEYSLTRLMLKLPYFGHLMWRTDSFENPDVRKNWRQEEKGTIEDEMVGRHHKFSGHEFE